MASEPGIFIKQSESPAKSRPPIPAFSPRKPITLTQPNIGFQTVVTPSLASGFHLIVRGVGADSPNSNPVPLVEQVIRDILSSNTDIPETPLVVKPFRSNTWTTTCYVHLLSKDIRSMDVDQEEENSEPRVDLLEPWIALLSAARPDWEVTWAPATIGTDKRTWLRFPSISNKNLTAETVEKAKEAVVQWLNKHNYPVCNAYVAKHGGLICTLANPRHVDQVLAAGQFVIKPLSQALTVDPQPGKQIEIENAFELVIRGLEAMAYENLDSHLACWLSANTIIDDQITFTNYRVIPDESDFFIFHMTTWKASAYVLSEEFALTFMSQFGERYKLSPPQSLHALNTLGLTRRPNLQKTLATAADQVSAPLRDLAREFAEFKKETTAKLDAASSQLSSLGSAISGVTTTVLHLQESFANTQRAISISHTSNRMQTNASSLRMKALETRQLIACTDDEEKKKELKEILDMIQEEIKGTDLKLAKMDQAFDTMWSAATNPDTRQIAPPPRTRGLEPTLPQPPGSPSKKRRLDNTDNTNDLSLGPRIPQPVFPNTKAPATGDKVVKPITEPAKSSGPEVPVRRLFRHNVSKLHLAYDGRTGYPMRRMFRFCQGGSCGILNSLRDIAHDRRSHLFNSRLNLMSVFTIMLLLLAFVPTVEALQPHLSSTSTLSILALNANGLIQQVKVQHINDMIRARSPGVFVLGETKTQSKLSTSLPYDEYNIYEEPGQPAEGHHIFKWGIVVGVRKDIQVAQRITCASASFKGRVIVLDLALRTQDGRCFLHRMIGAYAPWNPGGEGIENQFWPDMISLCSQTTTSWSLAGDLNATVSPVERSESNRRSRAIFLNFLATCNGHDLWSDYPDRNRTSDWTCKSRDQNSLEGNIIDRVVNSSSYLIDAEIAVANKKNDWVPYTDHRAIAARITVHHPIHVTVNPINNTNRATADSRTRKPRIRMPGRSEKTKYEDYQTRVDSLIDAKLLSSVEVTDDDTFIGLYRSMTNIITTTAEKVFGLVKPKVKRRKVITNGKINNLLASIRAIGGAIRLEKCGPESLLSMSPLAIRIHVSARLKKAVDNDSRDLLCILMDNRKVLQKELFAEKSKEILEQARKRDRWKIENALKRSTKTLVNAKEFIDLPLAVNDLHNPELLVCDPDGVKATTREYFETLYDHSRTPDLPKPWLQTPSIIQVRNRVLNDQFEWPKETSLTDFRALLRRGNNRPAPGPDHWEKWTIKALSDKALSIVLRLHNYIVLNSRFPGDLKDMWLTMFHKRGLRTDLHNWRGLLLSNFLANTPMSWLNYCLMKYATEKRILPDTQVATQPGVQTRDLTSYIASIKAWATRNKVPVYAVKRDQMKGFDYLSPEGFYDAIRAYGLPQSVIDIDRAAQTDTKCFIRTAHGITQPITVSGVNKQGGAISPLKSTFTTSMGHYYLVDGLKNDKDALVITTASAARKDHHTPLSRLSSLIAMVEATDDTILFHTVLTKLIQHTLKMERFQYAYGWLTQWTKTLAYVLAPQSGTETPSTVDFQSVSTGQGVNPLDITTHEVPLIADEIDFLRTKIDDPSHRFRELKDFIEGFQFPVTIGRPPITLLRKIVSENIISRCRALLYNQPIKQTDAESLDRLIVRKVHDKLGFPFQPSTSIATLPITHHGLGFPSVARLNAAIAVTGIVRDLNHHISAYRDVALITLQDWMCEKNECIFPLDPRSKTTSHSTKGIPHSWLTAQEIVHKLSIGILPTDQTAVSSGEVSLTHALKVHSHSLAQKPDLNGTGLTSLRKKGIQKLSDIGTWRIQQDGRVLISLVRPEQRGWTQAAKKNWEKLHTLFHHKLELRELVQGALELAVPREVRRTRAELFVQTLPLCHEAKPSQHTDGSTWASDGSMKPASASILDDKSVTSAVVGTTSIALRVDGRNISILQGEQVGLISSLILSRNHPNPTILTDHLNSVRLLEDASTTVSQALRIGKMNGRSYYRWMISLHKRMSDHVTVQYTPGHSSEQSVEARMNAEADALATGSQSYAAYLAKAPVPTFDMDPYTIYDPKDGWIESSITQYIDLRMAQTTALKLALAGNLRMTYWLYEPHKPPEYPYLKAASAYSTAVQLYARSGQLPVAETLRKRGKEELDRCRLGCSETESVHHIFVLCETYGRFRDEARSTVVKTTLRKLDTFGIEGVEREEILHVAKSLFNDDAKVWPLTDTSYYLGQIPPIGAILNKITSLSQDSPKRNQIHAHLCNDWHLHSIRLAGRIFGDFQRRMAVQHSTTP